jgi:hypothetical protein
MDALPGIDNPFRDTIVKDPWQPTATDVVAIHAQAFKACCERLVWVQSGRGTTSALLHGEAGSGKTHLLRRFRAHVLEPAAPAGGRLAPQAVFTSAGMQTTPRLIWRHVLRSFADDLLRPTGGGTQLEDLLLSRLARVRGADGDLRLWWQWLKDEHPSPDAFERLLDDMFDALDAEAKLGRNLCRVLQLLLTGRHRRDARAWLSAEPLPETALTALGLATVAEEDEEQEDRARRTLIALCALAGPKVPVVFCFDQLEALQRQPQDTEGLFAFGQLAAALHHGTQNALLISCIQTAVMNRFKDAVQPANWPRLAGVERSLDLLTRKQAKDLLVARLAGQPELARLRASHPTEPLWPLPQADLDARLGTQNLPARKVLFLAAELYDGRSVELPLPEFLDQTWEARLERARSSVTPDQMDGIISHGLPLLAGIAAKEWQPFEDHALPDVDLAFRGADGNVGLSLCNHRHLNGMVSRLKRLQNQLARTKLHKLVLLRDPRLPISAKATATHKLLDKLTAAEGRLVRPSVEALSALEALRTLLSDAQAGDLAHGGDSVSPATVRDWLAAHLPVSLREFLEEVVSYPSIVGPEHDERLFDQLSELLGEQYVLPLEEAAARLELSAGEVEDCARRHGQQFGLLSGPPAVLYHLSLAQAEVAVTE